jgi:hypothetical protein
MRMVRVALSLLLGLVVGFQYLRIITVSSSPFNLANEREEQQKQISTNPTPLPTQLSTSTSSSSAFLSTTGTSYLLASGSISSHVDKVFILSFYFNESKQVWFPSEAELKWLNDSYFQDIPRVIFLGFSGISSREEALQRWQATQGLLFKWLIRWDKDRVSFLRNKGKEAQAYYSYLVDFYDHLPCHSIFVHGHETSWHSSMSIGEVLKVLKWGSKPYINLNWCNTQDPNDGCHAWTYQSFDLRKGKAHIHKVIPPHWHTTFGTTLGIEMPKRLAFYCCAQFVATREAIRGRPKSFYQHMRNWILMTPMRNSMSSRMAEYTWGFVMGEPADMPRYSKGPCLAMNRSCDGCGDIDCPPLHAQPRRAENFFNTIYAF